MRYLLLVFCVAIGGATNLVAQASPTPTPGETGASNAVGWGLVTEGNFRSEKLGLAMPIPSNYHLITTAETDLLKSAGSDILKLGDAADKRIDEAVSRTRTLLGISEKPLGSRENAVFELAVIKQQAGVTARMSLAANVMLLKGTPYTLKRSLDGVKIGSNTWAVADFDAALGEAKFFQRMYVLIHRGYSLTIAINYFNDSQRDGLEKVIGGMTLTK